MATAVAAVSRNLWVEIIDDENQKPQLIELWEPSKDEAEWFSKEDERFTITFLKETPFRDNVFYVPRGGSVCSGPPRKDAKHTKYTYEIRKGTETSTTKIMQPGEIVIKP